MHRASTEWGLQQSESPNKMRPKEKCLRCPPVGSSELWISHKGEWLATAIIYIHHPRETTGTTVSDIFYVCLRQCRLIDQLIICQTEVLYVYPLASYIMSRLMVVSREAKKEAASDALIDSRCTHIRVLQEQKL